MSEPINFGIDQIAAARAFETVNTALNMVLPGADYHSRYQQAENVGLAVAVANGTTESMFDVFDPEVASGLGFLASNLAQYPAAWGALAIDRELLGADAPEDLGRFSAFAIAKINTMVDDGSSWSMRQRLALEIGRRVGFAGGARMGDRLVATSGLWEVHDHLATGVFDRLSRIPEAKISPDQLADKFQTIFGTVKSLHEDAKATEIPRPRLSRLVKSAAVQVMPIVNSIN